MKEHRAPNQIDECVGVQGRAWFGIFRLRVKKSKDYGLWAFRDVGFRDVCRVPGLVEKYIINK